MKIKLFVGVVSVLTTTFTALSQPYGTTLRSLNFYPTNGTVVAPMGTNFNSLRFTNSVTISPSPQSMLYQQYGLPPHSLIVYNTNTNEGTRGLLVSLINRNLPDSILFHATSKDSGSNTNTNTGVSRFIVLADGKVGINNNFPQHTLHVSGDTRISQNLLMPDESSIKAPELTNESTWGTWLPWTEHYWGPKAFLRETKVKELYVKEHSIFDGRLTIQDPTETGAAFNVKENTGGIHAARIEHTGSGSAKGLFVTLSTPFSVGEGNYIIKGSSGVPVYGEGDAGQLNVTERFTLLGDGKVGFNINTPEYRFHIGIPNTALTGPASFVMENRDMNSITNVANRRQFGIWLFPIGINPQVNSFTPTNFVGSLGTDGSRLLVKYGSGQKDWGELLYKTRFGDVPEIPVTVSGASNLVGGTKLVSANADGILTKVPLLTNGSQPLFLGYTPNAPTIQSYDRSGARSTMLEIQGNANKFLKVNSDESDVEWVDLTSGGFSDGTATPYVSRIQVSQNESPLPYNFGIEETIDGTNYSSGFSWPTDDQLNGGALTYVHDNEVIFNVNNDGTYHWKPLIFPQGISSAAVMNTRSTLGLGTNNAPRFNEVRFGDNDSNSIYTTAAISPTNQSVLTFRSRGIEMLRIGSVNGGGLFSGNYANDLVDTYNYHYAILGGISANSVSGIVTKGHPNSMNRWIGFIVDGNADPSWHVKWPSSTLVLGVNNGEPTQFRTAVTWPNATHAAITRTNLGLGGGVTTNITVLRPSNVTNTLQFSNGLLIGVTNP